MGAPTSKVTICNLALDLLNQDEISDLENPTNKAERLCARWYDTVRRGTLEKHTWNFALKRVLLPETAETPAYGFTAKYLLPSDFLRPVDIGDSGLDEDYEIEDGYLLLNTSGPLQLRYIYDHETVAKFDPLFTQVLSVELAMFLAPKFSGSLSQSKDLLDFLSEIVLDAHAIDGQARPPRVVRRSRVMAARRGITGRRSDIVGE